MASDAGGVAEKLAPHRILPGNLTLAESLAPRSFRLLQDGAAISVESRSSLEVIVIDVNIATIIIGIAMLVVATTTMVLKIIEVARSR